MLCLSRRGAVKLPEKTMIRRCIGKHGPGFGITRGWKENLGYATEHFGIPLSPFFRGEGFWLIHLPSGYALGIVPTIRKGLALAQALESLPRARWDTVTPQNFLQRKKLLEHVMRLAREHGISLRHQAN